MAPSSLSLLSSLFCQLVVVSSVAAVDPVPFAAKWSDLTFGPDGPWPAVEVTLGSDQKIALYPGREFQTFLLTSDYCNNNTTCPATKARLYNKSKAQVDNTGSTGQIQFAPGPNFMSGVNVVGKNAESWIDNMDLGGLTVPNVSLALLAESYAAYPDSTWYPLSAGCLGIGAPETVNQSFTTNSGPAINASLVPGWLNAQNKIPSNSFALHIGSANPPMPGSLYFGGYDRNRIVGDILTETDDYTKAISLKDISITVIDGSSPWEFTSKNGLLAANNASISTGGIKVSVDGCSPYLTLPKSTCDAIADHLPVKYNEKLGLYIWQENDEKYTQVVSSASTLDFKFLAGSNTQYITISIPFRHLNLTLTEPLVENDQRYFPCYTGPSSQYTLGRAFLQDAFVGANWDTKTWWLAQAPGPNIPNADVVTLAPSDTKIQASTNDWKESWSGSWKALTPEDTASSQAATPASPGNSAAPSAPMMELPSAAAHSRSLNPPATTVYSSSKETKTVAPFPDMGMSADVVDLTAGEKKPSPRVQAGTVKPVARPTSSTNIKPSPKPIHKPTPPAKVTPVPPPQIPRLQSSQSSITPTQPKTQSSKIAPPAQPMHQAPAVKTAQDNATDSMLGLPSTGVSDGAAAVFIGPSTSAEPQGAPPAPMPEFDLATFAPQGGSNNVGTGNTASNNATQPSNEGSNMDDLFNLGDTNGGGDNMFDLGGGEVHDSTFDDMLYFGNNDSDMAQFDDAYFGN
ncbi:hypothetical protein NUW58_g6661 [Xylaria curta]|uniref:Uncharacterized protein n=1 Tax=Xylaria curta TaxID=42375 RepID=A0ACC1NT15_9PEZI|nr:hypothetical protein NUW58_g6661 [Xylaria curta]